MIISARTGHACNAQGNLQTPQNKNDSYVQKININFPNISAKYASILINFALLADLQSARENATTQPPPKTQNVHS